MTHLKAEMIFFLSVMFSQSQNDSLDDLSFPRTRRLPIVRNSPFSSDCISLESRVRTQTLGPLVGSLQKKDG